MVSFRLILESIMDPSCRNKKEIFIFFSPCSSAKYGDDVKVLF